MYSVLCTGTTVDYTGVQCNLYRLNVRLYRCTVYYVQVQPQTIQVYSVQCTGTTVDYSGVQCTGTTAHSAKQFRDAHASGGTLTNRIRKKRPFGVSLETKNLNQHYP